MINTAKIILHNIIIQNKLVLLIFLQIFQTVESEKIREMAQATEVPPKDSFQFTDDQEYPPLTQNSDD